MAQAPIQVSRDTYVPSPWGMRYHACKAHEILGAGAAGPGKSIVLLMDPFQQIITEHQRCLNPDHPHPLDWGMSVGHALHLRRTHPMLEETVARSKRWFPRIDPGARWNESKYTWTFSSGYRYQFGHCKDPDDWQQYYGAEPSWCGFDELVQFMEEQYEHITGRVRCSDPVLGEMLRICCMSNPMMDVRGMENVARGDPHWVRKRFVDPEPKGGKILVRDVELMDGTKDEWTYIYLPARLTDNPDKAFVKRYSLQLATKPAHIRSALIDGNWYITAGSYFGGAWDDSLNVTAPFRVPEEWKMFRSMDWGFKSPGCIHWWAMDEDGNLFCIRELTFQGKTVPMVAKIVEEIEKSLGVWNGKRSGITGPADTQLWEQRGKDTISMADEFARLGILWSQADKKSRQTNAERVYGRLSNHENRTTTPGLVIFSHCKMLRTTLPAIQTDPDVPEVPMDGGDDHWYDSCAYACAFAANGRSGIPTAQRKKRVGDWDDDDEPKNQPEENRGRLGYGHH